MFEDLIYWHWWALAIALGVVEIVAPGTYFLWLGGAAAVVSLGRFGPSRLGRRFAAWRACGLLAATSCLALEVVERFATPRLPADATVQLSVLGAAWALLTGWVWGRRSWEQIVAGLVVPGAEDEPGEREPRTRVRWTGREMGEA